ncbi:MAG: DUF4864 domain-containing protein [Chromatiales bacterium]|nr:DUF4864 domain-containing protein [Chromatiales bacterium]
MRLSAIVLAALLGLLGSWASAAATMPDPSLTPTEVVRIQLEALRANDEADRGIEVAFRFASPANRDMTGPLPRFARMIKAGPYALMLRYLRFTVDAEAVDGDVALVRVTLIGADESIGYVFQLSRQRAAPFERCWMTDAVSVHAGTGRAA